MRLFLLCSLWMFASLAVATEWDKKETIQGVHLVSQKENSTRTYQARAQHTYPYGIDLVKNAVTNYEGRCNDTLKSMRKFSDKTKDCTTHQESMIESFVVRDLKTPKDPSILDRFVVGRQVYNRGRYGYYELVQITQTTNDQKQRVLTVSQRMLSNDEARELMSPKFEKDSAFHASETTYTLTEVSPKETSLAYEYSADTAHWVLNKEISVPQVFAAISKSVNQTLKSIEEDSVIQTRKIAAED